MVVLLTAVMIPIGARKTPATMTAKASIQIGVCNGFVSTKTTVICETRFGQIENTVRDIDRYPTGSPAAAKVVPNVTIYHEFGTGS
jgi:hypothetical protein